jgi:peptidyl-prolyl cis-trans isomerase D
MTDRLSQKFTSKTSYFIAAFFIGAIIVSFVMSGLDGMNSRTDIVAKVDDITVSTREYNGALNQQLNFYSQMMGGKPLTAQQIKQFQIKENVLNGLIQQKLLISLAQNIGIEASLEEIKNEIKGQNYFQREGKFDVNLYKALLSRNNFNPTQYEEMMSQEIKAKTINQLFESVSVSKKYVDEILSIKNQSAKGIAVKINKDELANLVTVSDSQVQAFANDEKNQKLLQSLYDSQKEQKFIKEAEVKARHILYKVEKAEDDAKIKAKITNLKKTLNTKNFIEIAKKETEDPSGKSNGGDLGWFSKGRMVKEFEETAFKMEKGAISEPIKTEFGYHVIYLEDKKAGFNKKFEDVKIEITKAHLQKLDKEAQDKIVKLASDEIAGLLKTGNTKALEAMKGKYKLTLIPEASINLFEMKIPGMDFNEEELKKAFKEKNSNDVIKYENPLSISFYKIASFGDSKVIEENIKKESDLLKGELSRNVKMDLLKVTQENTKVVTYPNML